MNHPTETLKIYDNDIILENMKVYVGGCRRTSGVAESPFELKAFSQSTLQVALP